VTLSLSEDGLRLEDGSKSGAGGVHAEIAVVGCDEDIQVSLKASYISSLRPHTLVAEGLRLLA
jgi:hypothetical protein